LKQKQYNDNSPGQLKPITFKGENHFAFVPNPLPPALNLDLDLVNALSDADRALGKLAGLGWNMKNPQLLIRPFLNREAVLSSKIEGTQSDITDLYAYQAGQQLALPFPDFAGKTRPSEADTKEVSNYVEALDYGLNRLKELPIGRRFIL
jgi:Fic family protein